MRLIPVVLLLGCLLTGAGVVVAGPASACSCTGDSTATSFARADAVFTGSLASRSADPASGGSGSDPVLHVFAVETVFKGTAAERQGVVSPQSGAACGLEPTGDGPLAVFATRDADLGGRPFTTLTDGQYAAFLCGGTAELTPALEAELRALAASAEAPRETAPRPGAAGTELSGGLPVAVLPLTVLALVGAALLVGRRWWHRSGSGRARRG